MWFEEKYVFSMFLCNVNKEILFENDVKLKVTGLWWQGKDIVVVFEDAEVDDGITANVVYCCLFVRLYLNENDCVVW